MDDQTFAALADTHRREILLALAAGDDDAAPLDALDAVSAPATDRLRLAMHHTHLPKLEAAGLVEWDRSGLSVAPGPAFETVEPILLVIEEYAGARHLVA